MSKILVSLRTGEVIDTNIKGGHDVDTTLHPVLRGPAGTPGDGITVHNDMPGLTDPNAHPSSSITAENADNTLETTNLKDSIDVLDSKISLNTNNLDTLVENVQQFTISSPSGTGVLMYADTRNSIQAKVYWNGVLLTQNVHYTVDPLNRLVSLTDGDKFRQWDEVIIVTEAYDSI